jgi:hypothetical protein
MKRLIKVLAGLVVVVVLLVVVGFFFLDSLAKTAIERGATYALGVQTTLGSADVGVFSGDFRMNDLHVANPEGFDTNKPFLQLGEGYVAVSLGSLRQDTVELPALTLTNVQMSLEKKGSKSNYGLIAENLKRLESGGGEPAPKKEADEGKAFVIKEVLLKDVNVEVDMLPIGGELSRMKVPIKEIRLTDVGTKKSVKMGELTDVIIKAILAAVIANGSDLPGDLTKDLDGTLNGLSDLGDMGIKSAFELGKVEDLTKNVESISKQLDGATKGVEDLGKTVGDLFKKP